MARSKLLRIGKIQDHPSRAPQHPRFFDLFQRWQRQQANLIQFLLFYDEGCLIPQFRMTMAPIELSCTAQKEGTFYQAWPHEDST